MLAVEALGVHGNSDLQQDLGVGIGYRKLSDACIETAFFKKKKLFVMGLSCGTRDPSCSAQTL